MPINWKSTVGAVAPTIATALGGPLAGLAVKAIAGIFGLGEEPTDAQLSAAVSGATPDQLLALKKADQDFAVHMRELDVDLERISADDRNSARQREIAVRDWVPGVLGVLTVTGYFVVLTLMAWGLVKDNVTKSEAFLIMLGGLIAMTKDIYSYFFGSSAGSRDKDGTIKALSK